MPIERYTISWYRALWFDGDMRAALYLTLKVAGCTVVIAVTLSVLAALGLRHRQFVGRGVYEFAINLPFLVPEIVVGLALVTFFNFAGVALSFETILVGHILFCLSAAFRVIASRLEALPSSLEEAARDLGRGAFGAFWYVTLPGLLSALLTAALLVFALSFDQTVITILVSGPQGTIPTVMWARMRLGFTPELSALATFILVATAALVWPIARWSRRQAVF